MNLISSFFHLSFLNNFFAELIHKSDVLVLSLEIKTTFIKQVNPGSVFVFGRVVKSGKNIAFLEGDLKDKENNLLAKANQTVKLKRNFYNK